MNTDELYTKLIAALEAYVQAVISVLDSIKPRNFAAQNSENFETPTELNDDG